MVKVKQKTISKMLAITLALSVSILGWAQYRIAQINSWNNAIQEKDWEAASSFSAPYGDFARAHSLYEKGNEYNAALEAYSALLNSDDEELKIVAEYNMANVYVEWASGLPQGVNSDLSLPLLELAKQGYRRVLRADERHWNAKYNLELVLALSPDTPEEESAAEMNPERSPRAAIVRFGFSELP